MHVKAAGLGHNLPTSRPPAAPARQGRGAFASAARKGRVRLTPLHGRRARCCQQSEMFLRNVRKFLNVRGPVAFKSRICRYKSQVAPCTLSVQTRSPARFSGERRQAVLRRHRGAVLDPSGWTPAPPHPALRLPSGRGAAGKRTSRWPRASSCEPSAVAGFAGAGMHHGRPYQS